VKTRAAAALACAAVMATGVVFARAQATYLYSLATFDGPLLADGVRLNLDRDAGETYVIYQNIVHIFNASGMEVFQFGDDLDLGQIVDATAGPDGDILLLSSRDSSTIVTRCNFRGVPIAAVGFTGFPDGRQFAANRMIARNGLLYFANLATATVVVTDMDGAFRSRVEFLPFVEERDELESLESVGFAVDADGSIFLTMPALFRVFKRAPDGAVSSFGSPGSAPGKFGVVAGIATDSRGRLFVADRLRSVVLVFDRDFTFLSEFGYRGTARGNLVSPEDLAVDRRDRIYVSQWRRRGVSVFALDAN
jgi:hypothetical protein